MIHATNGRPPQDFGPTQRHSLRRAKDVINAPVVDGSLPRIAPQVTKIFQEISIRFAVVLRVVSKQVGLVFEADFEIEISRDKDNLISGLTTSPVNHFSDKGAATRSAKGICMRANQNNLGQVVMQMEGCRRGEPVARRDVVEPHAAIIREATSPAISLATYISDQHLIYTIRTTRTACVAAITIFQLRQQTSQLILAS